MELKENTPSLPEGKSTPLKEGNFTEFDEILAEFGLSKDEYEKMSVEELAELEV